MKVEGGIKYNQAFFRELAQKNLHVFVTGNLPNRTAEAERVSDARRSGELSVNEHRDGKIGMNAPSLNWIPKNSASTRMGTTVALVSGPRMVTFVFPACHQVTISQ